MVTTRKSRELFDRADGMSFASAGRMKLGLSPLRSLSLMASLASLVLLACATLTSAARASPRSDPWRSANAREDALADGDIDVEDIASQGPFSFDPPRSSASGPRTAAPRASGSAWLTLGGFSRQNMLEERREVGGFVVLGLPLDRFTQGPSTRTSLPVPDPVASLELRPASDPPPPQQTSPPTELLLTPRLARSCVAAAWRAAGLASDDARLDAIVSRAHWSALLPEARLRAVRFEDARLSLDTSTDTSKLRDSSGANIGLEARLTWRFDRVLYADDEPSFERIRLEQRDARARIGVRVLEALFHWQRAALDLRMLPPSQQGTRDEADVHLRVMEAEAALDVLTNGWFTTYESKRLGTARLGGSGSGARPIPTSSPSTLPSSIPSPRDL